MPSSADQPGLVLELARLAAAERRDARARSPRRTAARRRRRPDADPALGHGRGRYSADHEASSSATRALVTVRGGKIRATGRLFSRRRASRSRSRTRASSPSSTRRSASNAYVYDGPIAPVEAPSGRRRTRRRSTAARPRPGARPDGHPEASAAPRASASRRSSSPSAASSCSRLLAFQLPKLLGGSRLRSAAPTAETTTAGGETAVRRPVAHGDHRSRSPTRTAARARPRAAPLVHGLSATKDPFVQQVVAPAPTRAAGGTTPAPARSTRRRPPSKGFTRRQDDGGRGDDHLRQRRPAGARAGRDVPARRPVFVLVSEQPKAKTVVVGIAGGEYASGWPTTKLKVGKPLVLVNTTTGARYRSCSSPSAAASATAADDQKPARRRHGLLRLQRHQLARRRVDGRDHRAPTSARRATCSASAGCGPIALDEVGAARHDAAAGRRSSRARSRSSRASSRR